MLLSLPEESDQNYPVQVKTFIRQHQKQGVEHGVFFPQLVTLDGDKNPVRIFTGPLLKFHAETWAAHGYLEGVFELGEGIDQVERYLLINTTKEALGLSSTIETEDDEITIEHMDIGSIEVKVLLEE